MLSTTEKKMFSNQARKILNLIIEKINEGIFQQQYSNIGDVETLLAVLSPIFNTLNIKISLNDIINERNLKTSQPQFLTDIPDNIEISTEELQTIFSALDFTLKKNTTSEQIKIALQPLVTKLQTQVDSATVPGQSQMFVPKDTHTKCFLLITQTNGSSLDFLNEDPRCLLDGKAFDSMEEAEKAMMSSRITGAPLIVELDTSTAKANKLIESKQDQELASHVKNILGENVEYQGGQFKYV